MNETKNIPVMGKKEEILKIKISPLLDFSLELCKRWGISITYPLTILISIVLLVMYGLGYSFLYGYYFSGETSDPLPSLINAIVNPIPFNYYSVIATSTIITVSCILLFLLFKALNKSISNLVSILIIFPAIHICLTIFFVDGTKGLIGNAISFFYFWVTPMLVLLFLPAHKAIVETPFLGLSSFLLGLIISSIISLQFKLEYNLIFVSLILIYIILTSICFKKVRPFLENSVLFSFIVRFILFYPFSTFSLFIILLICSPHMIFLQWLLYSIIINTVLTFLIPYSYPFIKKMFGKEDKHINKEVQVKTLDMFIGLTTLFLLFIVFIPYSSLATGKYIRDIVSSHRSLDIINAKICGNIVAQKDGIFYISDNKRQLQILKSDDINVEKDTEKCKIQGE